MSNDFNYDGDDRPLDENGLPIYIEDEDEGDSSSQDLMDMIRKARGEDEDSDQEEISEEDEDSTTDLSNSKEKPSEEGGRYGDDSPKQNKQQAKKTSPKPEQSSPAGDSNWFSRLAGKKASSGGAATSKVASKAAEETAKQATKQVATKAGGKALGTALGPALPYIAIALLIIILIIFIVIIISTVVSFFQQKTDPNNMKNNSFITSEYFYGIRVAYTDDVALMNSLQLSYKQYAVDVLTNINTNNPDITINITLPNSFDNTTQIDSNITNMSVGIANIVATGNSDYYGIDFQAIYPQIKYFGLTSEQGDLAVNFLEQYISNNNLLNIPNGANIKSVLDTVVDSPELQYIYNRCEKVMIKDEIATEEGLKNIEHRQYIASVYMPNVDITIDSAAYTIVSEKEDFAAYSKLIEENNGTKNILREKETKDDTDIIFGFSSGKLQIKKFTSIDTQNVSAFSNELSLFDALKISSSYTQFFQQDSETLVYSWKPTDVSLYYLEFDANNVFIFTDFSINIY